MPTVELRFMFLKDKPDSASDRTAQMPELLQDYKAQQVRLLAQTRELERMRRQVRASAEREAAAIVTAARRDVRQVLVDARRELLVLVAQLQAVGCDRQEDASRDVVQGETTSAASFPAPADGMAEERFAASAIVTGARRDVREVLIEAQTELIALAEEARELRARIARQHSSGPEFLPERTSVSDSEVPAEASVVSEPLPELPASDSDAIPPPGIGSRLDLWPDRFGARSDAGQTGSAWSTYASLSPSPRVWAAIAAGVVFVVLTLALYLSMARRSASTDAGPMASVDLTPEATRPAASQTAPSPALAVPARDPAVLAVSIEVRRPAWIRTTIDGRSDTGRVFNAGETRTITARDAIVMRAGDAGAVFVSVNGAKATALGSSGQVVTRRFENRPEPPPLRSAALQTAGRETLPGVLPVGTSSSDVGTTGTSEAPASAPVETTAEREILRSTQRWFEAYFGGDAASMKDIATSDFSMVDERVVSQRVPASLSTVNRGLQQVRIEVAGDGAVMSARLMEQTTVDGQPREYVSLVSGVWIRTDGRWRLMGVRFIDPPSTLR